MPMLHCVEVMELALGLTDIQPERSTAKATQQDNPVPSVLLSMTLHTTRSKCLTQTHVHRVGDAIQPSHPLLSPSPPAPNPSQAK